jgi:hypothetical protein
MQRHLNLFQSRSIDVSSLFTLDTLLISAYLAADCTRSEFSTVFPRLNPSVNFPASPSAILVFKCQWAVNSTSFYTNWLTNFMELRLPCEAANCAATQRLHSILWNPKVHYSVHKSPSVVPILSQIDPVHTIPPISILSTHICLGLPSDLFHSGFPTNTLYAFPFYPIRTTC